MTWLKSPAVTWLNRGMDRLKVRVPVAGLIPAGLLLLAASAITEVSSSGKLSKVFVEHPSPHVQCQRRGPIYCLRPTRSSQRYAPRPSIHRVRAFLTSLIDEALHLELVASHARSVESAKRARGAHIGRD